MQLRIYRKPFTARELKSELLRKLLHALIALVPFLAAMDRSFTALLLMCGTLFYSCMEGLRFLGFSPPFISAVTSATSRKQEHEAFVLGPVTLGLGALLALLLFSPKPAAIAVYVLAFGDSISSLVGRFLGHLRPSFLTGKSIEGSLTCFVVSTALAFLVFGAWETAVVIGLATMLIDALSIGDFDNILIPLAAGLAAQIMSKY